MVFNATFNTISAILWRSVLLVEETGGSGEKRLSFINKICKTEVKYLHLRGTARE
jgi:hypothetical protein